MSDPSVKVALMVAAPLPVSIIRVPSKLALSLNVTPVKFKVVVLACATPPIVNADANANIKRSCVHFVRLRSRLGYDALAMCDSDRPAIYPGKPDITLALKYCVHVATR